MRDSKEVVLKLFNTYPYPVYLKTDIEDLEIGGMFIQTQEMIDLSISIPKDTNVTSSFYKIGGKVHLLISAG